MKQCIKCGKEIKGTYFETPFGAVCSSCHRLKQIFKEAILEAAEELQDAGFFGQ